MANLVTLGRLLLLIVVVLLAYQPYSWWHVFNVALLIVVFASDGIDGYIARKRNEATVFGAVFDIAGDRITELTLWIVTADLGLVPIWVLCRSGCPSSSSFADRSLMPFGLRRFRPSRHRHLP